MRLFRPAVLLSVLLGATLAAPARAQFGAGAERPVTWTVAAEPEAVVPGGTTAVTFTGTFPAPWRMYAMDSPVGRPLAVAVADAPSGWTVGAPQQAAPKAGYDTAFESDYTYFEDQARVVVPVRVPENAGGAAELGASVTFMVCNDSICLPPRTERFTVGVRVTSEGGSAAVAPARPGVDLGLGGGAPADTAVAAVPPAVDPSAAEPSVEEPASAGTATAGLGLWAFLMLAVGAGLAALLTPCVFPMIPLTVSYFLHHAGSRRRAVRMALVYGLSIVVIFTGLGVAMAALVGAAGAQLIAANPWVNLFIGLVLVAFGLSLLGFYELRLPADWLNFANRQSDERGGYVGVLFMGLTLTLVSFSCTVPFVAGLLATAVQDEWAYPVLGMIAFSATFALPFVLFALFPRALNRLPRSGSWMMALKGTLGFIEIAAALKFLSNADLVWGTGLLSRTLAVALSIVLMALAGFFLLGKLRLGEETPEAVGVGPGRLMGAVAFFGLALYFVPGLLGAPLGGFDAYLPPRQAGDVSLAGLIAPGGGEAELEWIEDDPDEALAVAQRTGKPVFIDFTGYTCTNCRFMEANVFPQPPVAQQLAEDFVRLRLWTDDARRGEALQQYQLELTGQLALPTYAVVSPAGELLRLTSGVQPADRFAAFLAGEGGAAAVAARVRL